MANRETTLTEVEQLCNPRIALYATYLRQVYEYKSQSHTTQHWSHLPECEFIKLKMINDEKQRRGGTEEEMVRLAHQGRVETIMNRKTKMELDSLFMVTDQPLVVLPPPPLPRVVLIEGPPGGGKSTLALYICKQWTQDASFLSGFDLVVIAYLQDQDIQNAKSLVDILPADSFKRSHVDASTQIRHSCGHKVLFIFDGWDEFPRHLQKKSLVSTIIRDPHELSLHKCSVLITSRPVSSGNLFNIVDRRVEILGFTQRRIHKYIEKALKGNSTHIQKLVQHLEDHPVVESYCYIPLHAAILVHVFLTRKGVLPTTLHGLFCNFVLGCIVRELETHKPMQILPQLSSLDDLPENLKSQLGYLCALAYEGVLQDKVVFYQHDLEVCLIPDSLPSLGLLQAVEGFTLYSKSLSYNFLHLSVQELLAAYHISQMDLGKQIEIFKSLLESPRFHSVMQYYGGFTKLADPAIRDFISKYTRQQSSFDNILPFLHCFFEAHERSLCLLVDRKFSSIKLASDMDPVVFLSVGYFVTSLLMFTDTPNEVYLEIESINDQQMKLLLTELSKCPPVVTLATAGTLPCGLAIDLHYSSMTKNKVISFIDKSSPLVTELSLQNGNIQGDEDVLIHIAKTLLTNSYFTKLRLKKMNIQSYNALTEMHLENRSLTHLDLSFNESLSDAGAHGFFEVLQCNTTLVHLNLYRTGAISDTVAKYIAQFLITNRSIQTLDISGNHIREYGFSCIAKSLELSLTIKRVYITYGGNVREVVMAVYQARQDKKLDPFKLFNDYM